MGPWDAPKFTAGGTLSVVDTAAVLCLLSPSLHNTLSLFMSATSSHDNVEVRVWMRCQCAT